MKAFLLKRYGKRSTLESALVPDPRPAPGDVLVQIHAAGINLLDAKIRDGGFKLILPYKLPLILGHDIAGTVLEVSAGVRHFKPGDRVFARLDDFRIGAFAEQVAVRESSLAPLPANLSMEEAASLPLVALTAWQALVETAAVKPGQKVFIQAGSGGVGTVAIQLAKHLGATVATTTSQANIDLVRDLGADVIVDYRKDDFSKVLKGYDVALISQGADSLRDALKILKPGAKLITISGPPDPAFGARIKAPLPVRLIMRALSFGIRRRSRKLGIDFSFLFMRADGSQLGEIAKLLEATKLKPVLDRVLPIDEVNQALALVEAGRTKGKIVLKVR